MPNIPGPKKTLLKEFINYRKDPIKYFNKMSTTYGDIVKIPILNKDIYFLTNPEDISHVLKKNASNYLKGRTTKKLIKVMGEGLITADGKKWRKNHKIIRPNFTKEKIIKLCPLFLEITKNHIDGWKDQIDIFDEIHSLSLKVAAKALFGVDIIDFKHHLFKDIDVINRHIIHLTRSILKAPSFIPTKKNREFKNSMKDMRNLTKNIIKNRIELLNNVNKKNDSTKIPDDLLSLIISKDNLGQLSDIELEDEVLTLLLAGFETISTVISWTLITLLKNEKYIDQVRSEAHNLIDDQDNINFELIENNTIVSKVILESMRLRPPIWVFMREAINEDQLRDYKIPKGAMIIVGAYFMHRDDNNFENAKEFLPERFSIIENINNINAKEINSRFIPFGYGPRTCLGNRLAMYESQIILSCILKKFKFSFERNEEQKIDAGITLKPMNNRIINLTRLN
jgi:cytochrome P450